MGLRSTFAAMKLSKQRETSNKDRASFLTSSRVEMICNPVNFHRLHAWSDSDREAEVKFSVESSIHPRFACCDRQKGYSVLYHCSQIFFTRFAMQCSVCILKFSTLLPCSTTPSRAQAGDVSERIRLKAKALRSGRRRVVP